MKSTIKIVFTLNVILSLMQIAFSFMRSTDGELMLNLEKKLSNLNTKNMHIRREIGTYTTLSRIELLAKERGFKSATISMIDPLSFAEAR